MSANPPPYTDFSKYSETPPPVSSQQGNYPPQGMPMPQSGYDQPTGFNPQQPGFNQQLIYQPQHVPNVTVVTQQPCRKNILI